MRLPPGLSEQDLCARLDRFRIGERSRGYTDENRAIAHFRAPRSLAVARHLVFKRLDEREEVKV